MADTEHIETESRINAVAQEVSDVKNFLLETEQAVHDNDYYNAKHFINKAENISTCSYCKDKLQKFNTDINNLKNICTDIHNPICSKNKKQFIEELNAFYNKLPNIEEIRKNKILNQDQTTEDPLDDFMRGLSAPFVAISEAWDAFIKGLNQ